MTDSKHFTLILIMVSTLITASSRVFLAKGLHQANAITGMIYSLIFGWAALFILFISTGESWKIQPKAFIFFAGVGVIAPPIVRFLTYLGIEKLGPSRSDPIRSLTPIFAILFAIIAWGRKISLHSISFTLLIIIGVSILSLDASKRFGRPKFKILDLIFPFLAAILAGLVSNLRKMGMEFQISPIQAAFIAATSALFTFGLYILFNKKYKQIILNHASVKFLAISGCLVAVTDIIDLIALKHLPIETVAPLLASTPLIVILLSTIFLKNIETISSRLVTGALLIFSGVVGVLINA